MRYAQIRSMDVSNGDGIGVSLFVQGCHFHCKNCFNSETWNFKGGKEWTDDVKNKFFKLLDRPYIKRVSILGGEPLCDENINDVYELMTDIHTRFPNINIWLYTGYTWEELNGIGNSTIENTLRKTCPYAATVIVDGRYVDELKDPSLKWAGSTNQRVIDVKKSFETNKIVLFE